MRSGTRKRRNQSEAPLTLIFSARCETARADGAPSGSKREAERKVYRADGVTGAPIQIVAVLKPHRADNALPADAAPGRIDGLIRRIIPQVFREADAIHKSHQRQRRREELLKFHVSEQVRLG